MSRAVITGADGMLGTEVVSALGDSYDVVGIDLADVDITDGEAVRAFVAGEAPALVINCAAYTDVDGAESARDLAFAVNAEGAGHLARACEAAGSYLIHLSTDYVFDGTKSGAYTEADEPAPINVYGASKLEGEREVERSGGRSLIVRTAWLYGHAGRNFVDFVLKRAAEGGPLRIVDDQRGAPTSARDLALILKELAARRAEGIIHATNDGSCSWFEFAREIVAAAGDPRVPVEAIASTDLDRPAPRPRNSVLSLERLASVLGWRPRTWSEAVREYVAERQALHAG
jgi:dTDP-4-dehydrorhamnose reductase